ncbi:hypothetical protein PGT21_028843 [Puccinia graminis f. sp. tritici]|uniref:Phospholipid/glycerol acyltransferase domain-containing protein n=1 Tax=Puccinia graminis f. sp. tritici TaxID=56615 RepID=A0A5B0QCD6_PUCGR|nr:hypothetical protein PGT21_028843 [Puccinia graminis f. sp. tritici]
MTTTTTTATTLNEQNHKKPILRSIKFNSFFFSSAIFLHLTQLLVFPFVILSDSTFTRHLRLKYNCLARKTFAIILILITQIFAPTNLVLTSDHSIDLNQVVRRDKNGNIIAIDLPSHSIIMANHQIYADWLYVWSLAYLADIHSALIIILKASLKWVPLVGPAMQMFSFIFLNRSWATDKKDLTIQLDQLADQTYNPTMSSLNKIGLLIFPEGTLVSPLTRPASKKYAEKCGVDDLKHCLLPRSTGSLFCMRALSQKIPDLKLIDLTIGYSGVPADGHGQDYYTLQSIFGYGRPPPKVHIHIKVIPVSEIPIGHVVPRPSTPNPISVSIPTNDLPVTIDEKKTTPKELSSMNDPTPEEVDRFDSWLRGLWVEKDMLLDQFYAHGRFDPAPLDLSHKHLSHHSLEKRALTPPLEWPIQLKNYRDLNRTFGLALPGVFLVACAFKLLFF